LIINTDSYLLPNIFHNINIKYRLNRQISILASEKNTNKTFNSTKFNKKESSWVTESVLQPANSTEEDNFPSFNKFLENRNKKEEEITRKYFEKADRKAREIEEEIKNPHSKDLKLLTYRDTIEWSRKWVNNMINYGPADSYPKFIYDNIYDMREFCKQNISKRYFYIGYYPKDSKNGPYYIGAFELIPAKRELITHLIIQNPNYLISDKDNINRFINYKKELLQISYESNVIFKFDKLKKISGCERYYLSWTLEDND